MCTSVVEQQRKIAAEKLRSAIAETLVDDSAIIELERKQQSKHKELKTAIDFAPLLPSFRSIYSIPPPPLPFRLAAYLPPPSLRFRPSTPLRQQQLPPLLPFRIVYSREFILRCAASPHSTLPPKNMPELLLSYNEIVVKFPRRFPSHDWLLVRWVDDNKNTNKKKKGNNNGQQQQKTMMMGKPWHLLMMMVNSNNQFLHGLI